MPASLDTTAHAPFTAAERARARRLCATWPVKAARLGDGNLTIAARMGRGQLNAIPRRNLRAALAGRPAATEPTDCST